ncbi:response regulator transcription factor [Pseudoxanthomonas wuyuanensis]|uniref:DNA-binding response regulator, OmpR family, contains REC and winged-helix (WHTH) domain n=1 Tax=Pseudoxanthomonas wuyuanensis TaxID=1073196 RepID=A0A286D5Y5_9GAMM|nr:response regulator transcription factor [Pseudoxanthomonas wuyuanensis]KAF1716092.1 DNA-binding response regulator [Pseudoxanthomonas wuyuanensis]SOD54046.1 DNA-binding response regulator, OmpR family, contains REC and winged-helix (wHTH) domain [Pseudoxanthomonas wuyuanensis]
MTHSTLPAISSAVDEDCRSAAVPAPPRQQPRRASLQMQRYRLLVVEDDDDLRNAVLLPAFADAGYACTGVGTALEMYRCLAGQSFDLILLDIGLPDEDGFRSIKHLRSLTKAAIIILTGMDSDADRIRGLSSGADAYLSKPIDSDVLLAWVRTIIRRVGDGPGNAADAQIKAATNWRLSGNGWHLLAPDDRAVILSPPERIIVNVLIAAGGKTVHRDELASRLMGEIRTFTPNKLEMLIHRFRAKVLRVTGQQLPLMAIRGVGYIFNA